MGAIVLDKSIDPAATGILIVQCAWCGRLKQSGGYSGPTLPIVHEIGGYSVSHGICPACYARVESAESLRTHAAVAYQFAA